MLSNQALRILHHNPTHSQVQYNMELLPVE